MMDFAKLNALTIPEGAVSRILAGDMVLWSKNRKLLPEGYTLLDYIDSDGNAYINTEFIPDSNSKVVMDCQHIGLAGTSAGNTFFGARTSASAKAFSVYFFPSAKGYRYMYGNGYTEKDASRITDRITIIADKNVATIGDKITITRPEQTFACEYPLFLCGMNNAGSVTLRTKLRMYSCKIYDGTGDLVRDYIPCVNAGGEVGMYDRVNGVFYGNAGTGAFTYG